MDDPSRASQNSSDYFEEEDSQFLQALQTTVLPGDVAPTGHDHNPNSQDDSEDSEDLEPPPPAQPRSSLKRVYSQLEGPSDQVTNDDEIYGPSHFDGFGQYMRRKRAKLQIQNTQLKARDGSTEGKTQVFKGLSIYINGWTRPSIQDLRQLIVQHGGVFQPYLDKKGIVTHIITCSLTPAKIWEFKNMKVVRPEWLTESVKAGILLPWRDFIYVHTERSESSQGVQNKQQGSLEGQITATSSAGNASSILTIQPEKIIKPISAHPIPLPPMPSTSPDRQPIDTLHLSDAKNEAAAPRVPRYASDASNPLAQRVMANPEWRKAHTSAAPDFIEGYYKNSRLHHLSTWKSELKDLVQEAQERAEAVGGAAVNDGSIHVGKVESEMATTNGEGVSMRGADLLMRSPTSKWKGKGKAIDDEERVIMHCDFDCFFVSAGLVSRPELKRKPVVVCHSQGDQGGTSSTSEIASSSYEARKFGIKNGMSLQQARKLCPGIITIPYEFERYKQFSLLFYTVLMSHGDDLQAVSVDEALIDVTNTVSQLRAQAAHEGSQHDPAKDYAETIRAKVRKATDCEISIGISHNILLARLATRKAKPGGSYHLLPEEVPQFMAPLEISDLHGFGWHTKKKAQEKLGVVTLGELAKRSKSELIDALGKSTGETLYNAIRGVDDRKLESDKPRKSVSCEINYGIRFENDEQAEEFIHQMAKEVKKRLDAIDMMGRSITLKIMKRDVTAPVEPPKFLGHGSCDLFSKQGILIGPGGKATSDDQVIGDHAWRMLKSFNFDPKELRGLGIQVQKLESASAAAHVPPGQAMLPFTTLQGQSKATASSSVAKSVEIRVQPPSQEQEDMVMRDSRPPVPNALDLPSFSQVDMSVFEALPRDVREELQNEYKRRSASPFTSGAPVAGLAPAAKQNSLNRSAPPIFPRKPILKGINYDRITRQLAPRSAASVSPQKSVLFALAQKKSTRPPTRMTDKALRDLGLDPEVFAALPRRVQDEQLTMARIVKAKGKIPSPPTERKILKPKKPVVPPGFVPYRAPAPKARYKEQPVLRQQGKSKKEKLAFTETDDIQGVLESWITKCQHWAPRDKDVEYLAKYLLQAVDSAKSSDVGVEKAIAIMKWWLVLLRRVWPGSELEEEGEPDGSQTDRIGQAWWNSFREVKKKMDVVARRKFGGRLSLK